MVTSVECLCLYRWALVHPSGYKVKMGWCIDGGWGGGCILVYVLQAFVCAYVCEFVVCVRVLIMLMGMCVCVCVCVRMLMRACAYTLACVL